MKRKERKQAMTVRVLDVSPTEEMIMNPKALPKEIRGWRYYRLEVGGCNEDCLYEMRVILPPRADPHAVCDLIVGMQAHEQIWKAVK